jgi:hypothetical protein
MKSILEIGGRMRRRVQIIGFMNRLTVEIFQVTLQSPSSVALAAQLLAQPRHFPLPFLLQQPLRGGGNGFRQIGEIISHGSWRFGLTGIPPPGRLNGCCGSIFSVPPVTIEVLR